MPTGLSTTSNHSSSYSTGMSVWVPTSTATSAGSSTVMSSPSATNLLLAAAAPSTVTAPAATSAAACDRLPISGEPAQEHVQTFAGILRADGETDDAGDAGPAAH